MTFAKTPDLLAPESAEDTLRELEACALEAEAAHRFDSVDRRSIRYVDDTRKRCALAPSQLALLVVAAYPRWMEQQAFFGHAGVGRRFNVEAHLAYVVEVEGVPLPLRGRKQALEVLLTRALPRGVSAPERPVVEPWTDEQYDALFADVAAKAASR